MSGGHFDYLQHRINETADGVMEELKRVDFPYSDETKKVFEQTAYRLKIAGVMLNRIDWLLSGDDGEETFHERLRKDVDKVLREAADGKQ